MTTLGSDVNSGSERLLFVLQCGAGLQTAGGQAAASHEEAVPHRGAAVPASALPPGGLHLDPQTQVQNRVQEARTLETLVPMRLSCLLV